jgi:hypothetical protein
MDHAITIGDLVGWIIIVGGIFAVLAGLVFVLSVFAKGFNH